jgi:putative oxidoreductase
MYKNKILQNNDELIHKGLLAVRILIGFMFILHGLPKITGGPDTWTFLGGAMANIGLDFAPAFWGLMAALSELIGGLLIMGGLFVRPAATLLAITMLVAAIFHFAKGEGFDGASHALEDGAVFIMLMFTGGGKYAADRYLASK